MRQIYKIVVIMYVATLTSIFSTSIASAYEEGTAGEAVVEGTITFKSAPPVPMVFDLEKFPNAKFCSQVDSDGKGHRIFRWVTVNNGNLQDVVVYIQNIVKGKPFSFNGTDVKIDHCRSLVQGPRSNYVGVVKKNAEIRILNDDADSADPKSFKGVLHNPHLYEEAGNTNSGHWSLPLSVKGQMIKKPVVLRKNASVLHLQCDQHHYENAYFYPVDNPYYAIVGADGTYVIEQVPLGKYKLIAWHPILGIQDKEIEVGATGRVTANFKFSK